MSLNQAIVLAAGLGTRMRPLTDALPKPLIEVAGKPLIDWCLDWLHAANIEYVVVNTSYRAEQLETHLATRALPQVVASREEPEPLETGGGIVNALPLLGNAAFVAMNSDAIFPASAIHPLQRMAEMWNDGLDFLMLMVPQSQAIGWQGKGDFIVNDAGQFRRAAGSEEAPYIFTGVEIIHPRVFSNAPSGKFSLTKLWDARRDGNGWHQRMKAIIHHGPWLNVGDLQGLAVAQTYLKSA